MKTVRDVMTTEVVSVTEDVDFRGIVETMVGRRVSALPVVDGREHVVGVVSEEDLLHKEEFAEGDYAPPLRARIRARMGAGGNSGDKASARNAGALMTKHVVTATPDASVPQAARSMERYGVNQLPVIDANGGLLGIVSRRDLLSVFLRDDEGIAEEARGEIQEALRPIRVREPTVAVEDGVVRLSGDVEHRSDAQALVRRVRRLAGVVAVEDDLRWRVDDIVPEYVRWSSGTP